MAKAMQHKEIRADIHHRRESVKGPRMTAWELVRLIEGSEMRRWWDKLAASSEARLQHYEAMAKSIALSQRSYAGTNCKHFHCVLVS